MSGVSITAAPTLDLDAVVAGGQQFIDRLAAFQDAKARSENALNDLHLGKGAREALDEAARHLDEAKAEADTIRNKALADANRVRDGVQQWKAETELAASTARAQAESHLALAEKKHAQAQALLDDANARAAALDAKIASAKQAFVDAQQAALAKL